MRDILSASQLYQYQDINDLRAGIFTDPQRYNILTHRILTDRAAIAKI